MSSENCIDVCNVIILKLEALGFDLGEDEDHEPILDALEQVYLVKIQDIDDFTIVKA